MSLIEFTARNLDSRMVDFNPVFWDTAAILRFLCSLYIIILLASQLQKLFQDHGKVILVSKSENTLSFTTWDATNIIFRPNRTDKVILKAGPAC